MTNINKKLILIVDDSIDNQALLKLLFEEKNFQVHTASNGKEALSILNELTFLPQIILLDAQMPVMDGFQFRVEQNKNIRIKCIPVIVMTGDDDILINERMNYPAKILVKPLKINSLVEFVVNSI